MSQSSESLETVEQVQDAQILAPQAVTPQEVELLHKEIDELKIRLEGLSRQTDSTRDV